MKAKNKRVSLLLCILLPIAGIWLFRLYEKNMHTASILSETVVIAHRGSSSTAPENSISSVEQAIIAQADLIELDFFINNAGDLLVIHDEVIDNQHVPSMSLEDFRQLDISMPSTFGTHYKTQRAPILKEMISEILKGSTPLLEYKYNSQNPGKSAEQAAYALVELLSENNWRNKVVVQSFDIQFLAYLRSIAPDIVLGWLMVDEAVQHIDTVEKELNPEIIGWQRHQLTKENLLWLRERSNARIWSWYGGDDKINDPAYTLDMLLHGIDGIITDYPAQAKTVLKWSQNNKH